MSTVQVAARQDSRRGLFLALLSAFSLAVLWSVWRPHDYFTWILETFPAFIGLAVLLLTYRRFPLTSMVYVLVFLHALILLVGGHYTYAEVPLFNWIRDSFHLARNHFDRVGHFAQGFVPAIIAREILLRRTALRPGGWLNYIVLSCCLAISAMYELLEWRVSVATGEAADAFLGTQGDPWDTQQDMATCLVGAIAALLSLSLWHDRQLRRFLK